MAQCDAGSGSHPLHQWRFNGSVSEYGMNPVGHRLDDVLEQLPSGFSIGFIDQLGQCEFAGSKQIQPTAVKTIPRIVC